jgi:outer membrane receptor protein involved in Fe transport
MNVVTSRVLFLLLVCQLISSLLFSGSTGKISGRITDEKTGEPVVGATILIVTTSAGAACDIDGNFVITNLTPGSYSVAISAIGYRKKIVRNVQVNVDFTTRVDERLSSEMVDLDAVIVVAEKPLVRRDLTSSQTSIDANQIRTSPVESVAGILSTQAGVVMGSDGALHFRGGRTEEVSYTVNGVSVNNPFTNSNSLTIATNAIQELSVVQGTFNAEYGNALSGVVETGLKEGGEKYSGQISLYSGDRYSSHSNIFMNIDKFDILSHYVVEGTLGGPIPLTDGVGSFFSSARFNDENGWLFGNREHLPSDRPDFTSDRWNIPMNGDGQIVPMNSSTSWTVTNRFAMKLGGTGKIGYDVVFNEARYQNYSHVFKYNPDGIYNNFGNDVLHAAEFSDVYGGETTLRVKAAYSRNIYQQYRFRDLGFFSYEPTENLNRPISTTFYFGGSGNDRFDQKAETYSAKVDLSSVLSVRNEMKVGAEARFPQMFQHSFTVLRDTANFKVPTIPSPVDYKNDSYARFPVQYSGYAQDKLEFESIVLNLGLRFDYFRANAKYIKDIFYPEGEKITASSKSMISPRLGVSYPITDRGIIHFSYGHFYQMPQLRRLFANPDFKFNVNTSATTFGNANLNPEQTITYEVGLQQQVTDNIAFNVTGFFKDVRDLFAVQTIRISGSNTFSMYVNKDYANIKGFTFALIKRKSSSDMFSASIDYTLQIAEGNDVSADAFFLDQQSGRESEKVVVPLDWDQEQTLNGTFTLSDQNNWNIGVIAKVGTGLPYTPYVSDNQVTLERNIGRKPMQVSVDLFADKVFNFDEYEFGIFVKIYNLFDRLNEVNVFDDTGRSTYTLAGKRGEGAAVERNVGLINGVHSMADYYNNPTSYSPPREIRFGFSLNF